MVGDNALLISIRVVRVDTLFLVHLHHSLVGRGADRSHVWQHRVRLEVFLVHLI